MTEHALLPHLFRTEYSKITTVLCRAFGLSNMQIAEDIVSDTFLLATETWGLKGTPENPAAWLHAVAKNKTKDYLKRNVLFAEKISAALQQEQADCSEIEIDLSEQSITDSQLQMLFAICHPTLPAEAQISLALRILCGFGIDEIAAAFLTNKQVVNKRLFRAKEKLRLENIKIALPPPAELSNRLENVLLTLYLLFNEGYYSAAHNRALRKDFCLEAMRLTYLLLENKSSSLPQVSALLSLMCFHASRFDARLDQNGAFILYEAQNPALWHYELISKGEYFLNQSAKGNSITRYHLEAAIAYWHTQQEDTPGKWESILQLYNRLLQLEYSPIIALNRTYALAKANGKAAAIKEAEKINLKDSHFYHSLLGRLYAEEDNNKALFHLQTALQLAKTDADKQSIHKMIDTIPTSRS